MIRLKYTILPEHVLAYRVLISENISSEKEQLTRATVSKLTYRNMPGQLKRIYDQFVITKPIDSIKVEPVYQPCQDDRLTFLFPEEEEFMNPTTGTDTDKLGYNKLQTS